MLSVILLLTILFPLFKMDQIESFPLHMNTNMVWYIGYDCLHNSASPPEWVWSNVCLCPVSFFTVWLAIDVVPSVTSMHLFSELCSVYGT